MNTRSKSAIVNCQRRIAVAIAPLASFFERARCELGFPEGGVTVRLISDAAIARLNLSFRGKRGPTDVLSFPANARRRKIPASRRASLSAGDDLKQSAAYIGDIAISPQTAAHNARAGSRTLHTELCILILHGMIHLAGYDHETDDGEMDRLETSLRRRLNVLGREKQRVLRGAGTSPAQRVQKVQSVRASQRKR